MRISIHCVFRLVAELIDSRKKNSLALFASSFVPTQKSTQIEGDGETVLAGGRKYSAAGNLLLNVMDFIIHSKQTYLFDLYYDDNCSVLFS